MPTLSLCMIVKNEEKFLEQCLNSVSGLVDETIIVDTGSKDKTKEIACRFTDKVFDFGWKDDFSAARNESLKYASGDWVLSLDADEVLGEEDKEKIKELVGGEKKGEEKVDGYVLIQRNYFKSEEERTYGTFSGIKVKGVGQTEEGFISSAGDNYKESKGTAGWIPTPIIRLFRREGAAFTGRVHEDVFSSLKRRVVWTEIPIHHFGKLDVEGWKKKWELYERLEEKKAEEERDYYAYFELGRQYLEGRKIKEAKEMFLKSVSLNPGFWLGWFNLGGIALMERDWAGAVENLEKAKKLNPRAVMVYSNLGVAYAKQKEFEKAIGCFEEGLKQEGQGQKRGGELFKNLGLCYHEMGEKEKAYQAFKKAIELEPEYGKEIKLG